MKQEIRGRPSFSYITVTLEPGEELVAEPDAMVSMETGIDMRVGLNGGFFSGLARKYLGGEALFQSWFKNRSAKPATIVLSQECPGDICVLDMQDWKKGIYLQPGAFLCSTPGVSMALRWAGFRSFLAREGLFRLLVRGKGKVWIAGYGHIYEKRIEGSYLVDTAHLVGYDPSIRIRLGLAGGLFSSVASGEGLVTRLVGTGTIYLQSRSLKGLAAFLNMRI